MAELTIDAADIAAVLRKSVGSKAIKMVFAAGARIGPTAYIVRRWRLPA